MKWAKGQITSGFPPNPLLNGLTVYINMDCIDSIAIASSANSFILNISNVPCQVQFDPIVAKCIQTLLDQWGVP